jgi:hypothetical protein
MLVGIFMDIVMRLSSSPTRTYEDAEFRLVFRRTNRMRKRMLVLDLLFLRKECKALRKNVKADPTTIAFELAEDQLDHAGKLQRQHRSVGWIRDT